MKTPREVLLEQHQQAERKLDLVRHGIISKTLLFATREAPRRAGMRRTWSSGLLIAWEQLVRPARYIWGGIAVTWLVLALVNAATTESSHGTRNTSPMVLQTFIEERKLLAELLQVESKPAPAPPKPAPSPRSEKPMEEEGRV